MKRFILAIAAGMILGSFSVNQAEAKSGAEAVAPAPCVEGAEKTLTMDPAAAGMQTLFRCICGQWVDVATSISGTLCGQDTVQLRWTKDYKKEFDSQGRCFLLLGNITRTTYDEYEKETFTCPKSKNGSSRSNGTQCVITAEHRDHIDGVSYEYGTRGVDQYCGNTLFFIVKGIATEDYGTPPPNPYE